MDRGRCRTVDEAIGRLQEAHRRQGINEHNDPLEFVFGDLMDTFTPAETAVLTALVHFTRPARLDWLLPLARLSEEAARTALDDLRGRALLLEDQRGDTWFLPPLAARFLRRVRPVAVGESGERWAQRAYALIQVHWHSSGACARKRAVALQLRGQGHTAAMDYPAAIADFRESLELYRGLSPTSRAVAVVLRVLGQVFRISGLFDACESHLKESLTMARSLPDPRTAAISTGNLALLALDRAQWAEAERLARESMGLVESLGHKQWIAFVCRILAQSLARQGRGAEGRCHAGRGVAIFTELRSPELAKAEAVLTECQ